MTMLRTIGTVALLMVSGELPALARAAVQDPGAYAFYHPNADVLKLLEVPFFQRYHDTQRGVPRNRARGWGTRGAVLAKCAIPT
jgi:hypothetical protein